MVNIKYPSGETALSAYTVAELIAELQKQPQDLPVVFDWEGQLIGFDAERIAVKPFRVAVGYSPEQYAEHQVLALYAEIW